MAKIQKISAEVKSAIQRKSAYSLPNNPTDSGFKASDIRNAFYKPIIDAANSALTEIDRVVDELNGVLRHSSKEIDAIESVAGVYYHGSDGLVYNFADESFIVCGYENAVGGKVTIPSYVFHEGEYYTVDGVAENAFANSAVAEVEIPASVTTIGNKAFFPCSALQKVTFYGNTSLGTQVFSTAINFSVPKEHLTTYETSLASYKRSLVGFDTILNNANDIVILYRDKVNKVTTTSPNTRVYAISETGAQITKKLVTAPTEGEIPMYLTGGRVPVGTPTEDNNATPRSYVEQRLASMGAYIGFSINPSNYKMTLQLKSEGGTVLSEGVVDLPLESMILGASYADGVLYLNIKTADGSMNNTTISVNISDLISGLVNDTTFNNEVSRLDGRINSTNIDLGHLEDEVAQKEIYAHAAFHSEEAETARNYTKGGGIDKKFREVDSASGTNLSVTMDEDYKLTVKLLNKRGEVVASGMVDLPIESLITKASYKDKILTLTFQSGDTLKVDISSIITGLVPETRKVNGKALTSDITLTASDVGAYGKDETYNRSETSNLIASSKQELLVAIEEHQVVGYAYSCSEADKASGYTKGGAIDKAIQGLTKRIKALEGE